MATFSLHEPLDVAQEEIRLINILPATAKEDPIHCEIFTLSLLNVEPEMICYDAISYVWGDSAITEDIYIDNILLPVTTNLAAALRRLRFSGRHTVWTDAVCINQTDLDERSQQVKLMGSIYSKACMVYIWLGEADEFTHVAFTMVQAFATNVKVVDFHNQMADKDARMFYVVIRILLSILSRPWFERLWTVQERKLARRCMLLCGEFQTGAHQLTEALTKFLSEGVRWARVLRSREEKDAFLELCRRCQQTMGSWSSETDLTARHTACDILNYTREHLCRDPRDKVYGLMGIAPWLQSLSVDYHSSVQEVWQACTVATARYQRRLDVLTLASTHESALAGPSWMLPLQSKAHEPVNPDHLRFDLLQYDACLSAPLSISNEGTILKLKGVRIGVVEAVGPSWPISFWDQTEGSNSMISASDGVTNIAQHRRRQLEAWNAFLNVAPDVLWDLMLCGVMPRDRIPDGLTERLTPAHHVKLHGGPDGERNDRDLTTCLTDHAAFQVDSKPVNSAPLKLSGGLVGTGSENTRVGDVVWVLAGSPYPYVLRPVEDGEAEHFMLGAPCYVYGMMDGEAVRRARVEVAAAEDVFDDGIVFEDVYLV